MVMWATFKDPCKANTRLGYSYYPFYEESIFALTASVSDEVPLPHQTRIGLPSGFNEVCVRSFGDADEIYHFPVAHLLP